MYYQMETYIAWRGNSNDTLFIKVTNFLYNTISNKKSIWKKVLFINLLYLSITRKQRADMTSHVQRHLTTKDCAVTSTDREAYEVERWGFLGNWKQE